jgi:hypothetical protein
LAFDLRFKDSKIIHILFIDNIPEIQRGYISRFDSDILPHEYGIEIKLRKFYWHNTSQNCLDAYPSQSIACRLDQPIP